MWRYSKTKENVESNLQEDSRKCLLRVFRQKNEWKRQRLMIEYLESQEKEDKVNRYEVGSQWRFGNKKMPG